MSTVQRSITRIAPTSTEMEAHATRALNSPPRSLLVTPKEVTRTGALDLITQLSSLISKIETSQEKQRKSSIDNAANQRAASFKKYFEELAEQVRNSSGPGLFGALGKAFSSFVTNMLTGNVIDAVREPYATMAEAVNSPNFWKDLKQAALVVAEVAACAATVVTFGSAAPLAVGIAVALSAASMLESTFQISHALGASEEFSKYLQIGLAVGSAVAGGATSLGSAGAAAANATASGARAIGSAGSTAATLAKTTHAVGRGVAVTSSAVQSGFEARALQARANAVTAQGDSNALQRFIRDQIKKSLTDIADSQILRDVSNTIANLQANASRLAIHGARA